MSAQNGLQLPGGSVGEGGSVGGDGGDGGEGGDEGGDRQGSRSSECTKCVPSEVTVTASCVLAGEELMVLSHNSVVSLSSVAIAGSPPSVQLKPVLDAGSTIHPRPCKTATPGPLSQCASRWRQTS